mmetsp:Transcript_38271/g.78474  ORF Transcript_38271/g.78474 Transcript_38271/m.78474 type:complete len:292 (+) Transcript_38271:7741-8616(+)
MTVERSNTSANSSSSNTSESSTLIIRSTSGGARQALHRATSCRMDWDNDTTSRPNNISRWATNVSGSSARVMRTPRAIIVFAQVNPRTTSALSKGAVAGRRTITVSARVASSVPLRGRCTTECGEEHLTSSRVAWLRGQPPRMIPPLAVSLTSEASPRSPSSNPTASSLIPPLKPSSCLSSRAPAICGQTLWQLRAMSRPPSMLPSTRNFRISTLVGLLPLSHLSLAHAPTSTSKTGWRHGPPCGSQLARSPSSSLGSKRGTSRQRRRCCLCGPPSRKGMGRCEAGRLSPL